MSLYIGRGQEQIFGYGSLLYALKTAHQITNKKIYQEKYLIVKHHVDSYIRKDGSIPLVLSSYEKKHPNSRHGWYSYNSFDDYVPFFYYYYTKENNTDIFIDWKPNILDNLITEEFTKETTKDQIRFLSKPNSCWSNNLSVPLVYDYKLNKITTPIYGGEQYQVSTSKKSYLPMPYGKITNKWVYFTDMKFALCQKVLTGENKYAKYTREIRKNKIIDTIIWKRKLQFEIFFSKNFLGKGNDKANTPLGPEKRKLEGIKRMKVTKGEKLIVEENI